jgi:insertion element IS1 protein InsB
MRLESLKKGLPSPKCTKSVVLVRRCLYCNGTAVIHGYTKSGKCRLKCRDCLKTFLHEYSNHACQLETNSNITTLLKEGVGIRSTSRLLGISATTVTKRILLIADKIKKPKADQGQVYEVDELRTYVGNKMNLSWIAYAMNRETRQIWMLILVKEPMKC